VSTRRTASSLVSTDGSNPGRRHVVVHDGGCGQLPVHPLQRAHSRRPLGQRLVRGRSSASRSARPAGAW
jgi:hypothetical protein